jgi:hypothetical protein
MVTDIVQRSPAAPRVLGLLGLLLGAVAAGPAAAQTPTAARRHVWVDAGLGVGYLRLTCVGCSGVAANGAALTVSAGGSMAHNVLLGVQGQLWRSAGGDPRQLVRSALAIVQWYPWPAATFYIRGGLGIVQGTVAPEVAGALPGSARGTGNALAWGVGYDFGLTPHLGVALQLSEQFAALGDLTVGGVVANDVIAYVTRIGVALVWR